MNLANWAAGKPVLDDYARLNSLFNQAAYSAADKAEMLKLLKRNKLDRQDASAYLILRKVRGEFIKRPKGKPAEIVATRRTDWVGWVELVPDAVTEAATENTARVFQEVGADIIGVVEAEDRVALQHFNDQLIPFIGGQPYDHVMLVDGNDERGIDVGLMTRSNFPIVSICSHVDDRDADGKRLFSRDCPEYEISLPGGATLWILANHLKSKGYGKQADSDARRKAQAARVREIYEAHRTAGHKLLAVIGDFNDTPESDALSPLLKSGSDLRDVSTHPNYQDDGRPGTYANGTASGKIDFILLSPALFGAVKQAAVMRKGVWGGKNGTLWSHFPTMAGPKDAASDHAALWVDLDF